MRCQTEAGANTHQFTGKEWNSEMGLNYFCQRYYDPQVGRFTALDPIDSPGASAYAYCVNNPLRLVHAASRGRPENLLDRGRKTSLTEAGKRCRITAIKEAYE